MPNNIKQQYKHSMETLTQKAKEELRERGVRLRDIADIVYDLQSPYIKDLSIEFCEYSINWRKKI